MIQENIEDCNEISIGSKDKSNEKGEEFKNIEVNIKKRQEYSKNAEIPNEEENKKWKSAEIHGELWREDIYGGHGKPNK